jgi:uncharacterized membrane protein YhhN
MNRVAHNQSSHHLSMPTFSIEQALGLLSLSAAAQPEMGSSRKNAVLIVNFVAASACGDADKVRVRNAQTHNSRYGASRPP